MTFLKILGIVLSLAVGIWMLGVFLVGNLHPKLKGIGVGNLIVGAPALAFGIWLLTV